MNEAIELTRLTKTMHRTALSVLILIGGCASIFSDKTQPVMVLTACDSSNELVSASCIIENDVTRKIIISPAIVAIPKSDSDLKVTCTVNGITSNTHVFSSKIDEKFAGNLVFGGLIGAAIDTGTGAGFFYPKKIFIRSECNK